MEKEIEGKKKKIAKQRNTKTTIEQTMQKKRCWGEEGRKKSVSTGENTTSEKKYYIYFVYTGHHKKKTYTGGRVGEKKRGTTSHTENVYSVLVTTFESYRC